LSTNQSRGVKEWARLKYGFAAFSCDKVNADVGLSCASALALPLSEEINLSVI